MAAALAAAIYKKQKSIVMKKLSAIIVAISLFLSAGAFTPAVNENPLPNAILIESKTKPLATENVTVAVKEAFKQKFNAAVNASWKENQGIYFVQFELNEKKLSAAYSRDGELVAVSRVITIDQLPLAVTQSLAEQYDAYSLPATATEIILQGTTSYYLIVQGKARNLQLKCSSDGNITVDKKMKKKMLFGSVE
jgi:hypothetical protein